MYPRAAYAPHINPITQENTPLNNNSLHYQTFECRNIQEKPIIMQYNVYNQDIWISFFNILFFLIIFFCDNCSATFWISFLALLTQTYMVSRHMDILENYVSPSCKAMIMYTMGNVPELLFSSVSVLHGKTDIIQESNVGSILSNSILLFGVVGCVNLYHQSIGDDTITISNSSLMALFGFPIIFYYLSIDSYIPQYIASSCLILIYFGLIARSDMISSIITTSGDTDTQSQTVQSKDSTYTKSLAYVVIFMIAMGYFCNVFVLSITPTLTTLDCSSIFLNIIVIPIIGNCIEIVSAVKSAFRKDMISSIYISVGSIIQILWFVYPLTFLIGSIISKPFPLQLSNISNGILISSCIGTLVFLSSYGEKTNQDKRYTIWPYIFMTGYIVVGFILY